MESTLGLITHFLAPGSLFNLARVSAIKRHSIVLDVFRELKMLDLLLFGLFYISWILFRNDELERIENRLGHELEHVITMIEDRNNEIEKKDELIFGLFEQVDQLKDNIEILQHELDKYASRIGNNYLELKSLKQDVDLQLSRESGFDETY